MWKQKIQQKFKIQTVHADELKETQLTILKNIFQVLSSFFASLCTDYWARLVNRCVQADKKHLIC